MNLDWEWEHLMPIIYQRFLGLGFMIVSNRHPREDEIVDAID